MAEQDYSGLKAKLELLSWPSVYMFKFIVPSGNKQIAQVEALFSEEANITHTTSGGGKYTCITIREVTLSADAVIEVYKKAASIEGVMAL